MVELIPQVLLTGSTYLEPVNKTWGISSTMAYFKTLSAGSLSVSASVSAPLLIQGTSTSPIVTIIQGGSGLGLSVTGAATITGIATVNRLYTSGSKGIVDSSDNELLKFSSIASAVNEVTITNAATNTGPTISATGDNTNIDLNITSKGNGKISLLSGGSEILRVATSTGYGMATLGWNVLFNGTYTAAGATTTIGYLDSNAIWNWASGQNVGLLQSTPNMTGGIMYNFPIDGSSTAGVHYGGGFFFDSLYPVLYFDAIGDGASSVHGTTTRIGVNTSTPQNLFVIATSTTALIPVLSVTRDDRIGINTSTPATTLDVNGLIRSYSLTTTTCDALIEGSFYYNGTNKHAWVCNGTDWLQLDN